MNAEADIWKVSVFVYQPSCVVYHLFLHKILQYQYIFDKNVDDIFELCLLGFGGAPYFSLKY